MSSYSTDTRMRGFADAVIGLEETLNYIMAVAQEQGLTVRLEADIIDRPPSPCRIHIRLVTPDMEVTHVPTEPGKAPLDPASSEAAG